MSAATAAWPLRRFALAACTAIAASAAAHVPPAAASAPDPAAAPQPAATVRDPDFGVVARHFGLERTVEMYQWRLRADGRYALAWSTDALDSAGFAPGHDNPPFPLRSRRWMAGSVSVDGVPLDQEVVAALGQWVPFRPSFSALPGNLAATFQPQGDGLGTAENPAAPQVGDLRVRWRELRLPPLGDRIVLEAGHWRLRKPASPAARDGDGGGAEPRPAGRRGFGARAAIAFLLLAALVFGAMRLLRGRLRRGRGGAR